MRPNIDPSKLVVLDIETIPLDEKALTPALRELLKQKLDKALKQNPDVDPENEKRKIMSTNPLLGRIVCDCLYMPYDDKELALYDSSEKVLLERFWRAIAPMNGLFVGFNHIRFDVPFIIKRSMINGVKPTNGLFLQYTKYDPYPPHFDVMINFSGRENYISLRQACELFNVPSPKEGAIKAEDVAEAYAEGRIKEIADYCMRDVKATYAIYQKIKEYIVN